MEILAYQAEQQITVGSTQEIAEKKQRVLNNIEVIKSKAIAITFGINLDGTAKTMTLQDYNQLKWYASQAEKDLFLPEKWGRACIKNITNNSQFYTITIITEQL